MSAQRAPESPKGPATSTRRTRKPWKKKTPVDLVLEQTDKLRAQIAEREEELTALRRQLQKFEEARKIFEVA